MSRNPKTVMKEVAALKEMNGKLSNALGKAMEGAVANDRRAERWEDRARYLEDQARKRAGR